MNYEDPIIDPDVLRAANERHDREHGPVPVAAAGRIMSSWNEAKLTGKGPLTDRKIDSYIKLGRYSAEYRQKRKELMEKKKLNRKGNFVERDGRLVYCPL